MNIRTFVIGLTLCSGYAAASDVPSGKQSMDIIPPAAQLCVSCHGAEGEGIDPLGPRLAGLSKEYISTQLQHFQAGVRQNATMMPMAMTLQGDGIEQVARYFAAKPANHVKPVIRGEQVVFNDDTARLAYQGDWSRGLPACVTCHGPSALGGGLFPRLAGQQASYIKTQLLAWQSGTRKGDVDGMMGSVANKLTVAEIDALANYFANLK
ncbi:c-type cytochrome [Shewanella sp. JNE10-2]|uniref:Cytochrome c class I n=1 Tax=Shewanella putrefaciens (strain 200) TaxID=399804 RepID=E6XHZ4_SHEP2|nr:MULTISPECIES: c-type cytochrome [unclassified Shewanella]MCK7628834.1 c-type cytochrome [Shewanella sp. JNE9-1]MCK7644083.1 c-type cytochrome [Shewanella sp. JNE3-1]MCK7652278.1 c-type cytochrome [Shewanella sp. JNE4-1]UPO28668.1 c-type cytochrome [Shewanella sp. JNE10-2]UPO35877.1 c-type cytochrome [Shewanella sp. JNE7]